MAAGGHVEYTKMAITLLPACQSVWCFSLAWAFQKRQIWWWNF